MCIYRYTYIYSYVYTQDSVLYYSAIKACEGAGQWAAMLDVLGAIVLMLLVIVIVIAILLVM